MIEWTGERCVPWAPDIQVVYEHFHRYLWASCLAANRRVLDLASGEGFGTAILSEVAEQVVGVEIDERAVQHAQLNYEAPNLSYLQGDARDLGSFRNDSFDAVVAFEMIEHVEQQQQVLSEIKRVLGPAGLLIMSTPNKPLYDDALEMANPYHVHELTEGQFSELLLSNFDHSAMWAQHAVNGSAMVRIAGTDADGGSDTRVGRNNFVIRPVGDQWELADTLPLIYMVAVASDEALPAAPLESALSDAAMRLTQSFRREAQQRDRYITGLAAEEAARSEYMKTVQEESAARAEYIRKLEPENAARGEYIKTLEAQIRALWDERDKRDG